MVPKSRPSSESGMSGTLSSTRICSPYQPDPSLLPMIHHLLCSSAFLGHLVDEGDGLSDVGLDVLGEFALVTKNLGGVQASGNESEAFFFVVGLRNRQPRSNMTMSIADAICIPSPCPFLGPLPLLLPEAHRLPLL